MSHNCASGRGGGIDCFCGLSPSVSIRRLHSEVSAALQDLQFPHSVVDFPIFMLNQHTEMWGTFVNRLSWRVSSNAMSMNIPLRDRYAADVWRVPPNTRAQNKLFIRCISYRKSLHSVTPTHRSTSVNKNTSPEPKMSKPFLFTNAGFKTPGVTDAERLLHGMIPLSWWWVTRGDSCYQKFNLIIHLLHIWMLFRDSSFHLCENRHLPFCRKKELFLLLVELYQQELFQKNMSLECPSSPKFQGQIIRVNERGVTLFVFISHGSLFTFWDLDTQEESSSLRLIFGHWTEAVQLLQIDAVSEKTDRWLTCLTLPRGNLKFD